jgi:hypothetical protein
MLLVGDKLFVYSLNGSKSESTEHTNWICANYTGWLQYDIEVGQMCAEHSLHELPIDFAPTYVLSRAPYRFYGDYRYPLSDTTPGVYASTRVPAWCDRVLMNTAAFARLRDVQYTSIGAAVCTGDHKPVVLCARISTTVAAE